MSEPIRIALIGARGKMGTYTRKIVEAEADLDIVCTIDRGEDLHRVFAEVQPQVGLDFTVAGAGAINGLAMLECGVRALIGTSGVTPEEFALLDATARAGSVGGLVVPNFSVGIWLQQELARRAAEVFQSVEVIEEHNAAKVDAPSATAIDTAAQLAEALEREPDEIPVHSIRLKGLYSNQTIAFGSSGEVLRISHETYGTDAFGPGILAGLRYVAAAPPGMERGVGHAMRWWEERYAAQV